MDQLLGLRLGLGGLPLITGARTRSISPENPTGARGRGGRAIPDPSDPALPYSAAAARLGQGWKVNPFVKPKRGETVTIVDVDGPGVIQHIWIATDAKYARTATIRMYWDGEESPSVEAPIGDFFAVGHGLVAPVNSLPVVVNAHFGLNCYWPMPFRRHARITVTNEALEDMSLLAFQVTYAETEVGEDLGYFHAQWRRATTERANPVYTILDGVKGEGQYVGTFLAWSVLSSGWWGEGEVKFHIDDDEEFPTICGTGTEDYFLAAYGFPENYSNPFSGCVLDYPPPQRPPAPAINDPITAALPRSQGPTKFSLYRWHVLDPVCFATDLKVTIQALGWWPDMTYQPLQEDIASTAFWYQREPHTPFAEFPALEQRWPR